MNSFARYLVLSFVLWVPMLTWGATGRLCVAPLPEFSGHPKPPFWVVSTEDASDLYVKLDARELVQVTKDGVSWIEGIDLHDTHRITIFKGDNRIESFGFRMSDFSFRKERKKDLCLYFGDFYFTWQLREVERTGGWCPCWSSESQQ